jgi:hypothetical protein
VNITKQFQKNTIAKSKQRPSQVPVAHNCHPKLHGRLRWGGTEVPGQFRQKVCKIPSQEKKSSACWYTTATPATVRSTKYDKRIQTSLYKKQDPIPK